MLERITWRALKTRPAIMSNSTFASSSFVVDTTTFILRPSFAFLTPISQLSLSILSFHFALHCSTPTGRFLLYLSYLYFAVLSFLSSTDFSFPVLVSLWAQSMTLNIAHITSVLFLEPNLPTLLLLLSSDPKNTATNNDQKNSSSSTSTSHLTAKSLLTSYRLWSNPQLLPRAPPNPYPSSAFLLHRLAKLTLYALLYTHIPQPSLPSPPPLSSSSSPLLLRVHTALAWLLDSLLVLDGANALLSILFVSILHLDTPADWPPLFTNPFFVRGSGGLRVFWGRCWHRLAARPYTNIARRCVATSSARALVAFLLSGLAHAATSWRLGCRDKGWLDVKWFLLNFAGGLGEAVVERAVWWLARRWRLERELEAVLRRSWVGRLIGWGWVFAFFFWTVPMWRYPRMMAGGGSAGGLKSTKRVKARVVAELLLRRAEATAS